jgi:LysR family transcriptional regulator, nitrogen assimilation regulatory protein
VDAGNITAAAKALNLAQPALGAQIRQLEEELGVALIVRHSRGISVTPAGAVLYKHAQGIIGSVDRAIRDVRMSSGQPQRQVRLGIGRSMLTAIGPDLPLDASKSIADFSFSVLEERSFVLLNALAEGRIDIAFAYNVEHVTGLQSVPVMEEHMLLVTAPKNATATGPVTFAEALRNELIIGGDRGVIRQTVEAQAKRLSLEMRIAFEVHSVSSMKTMLARGIAATIVPFSLAADELRSGKFVGRRIIKPKLTRTLYVCRRKVSAPHLSDRRINAHINKLVDAYFKSLKPWAHRLQK